MTEQDKYMEFANNINMDELFDEIKKVTGLFDLKFSYNIGEDRHGNPRISFSSQDLAEKVGFLKLMFMDLHITEFNSSVTKDRDTGEPFYWCTVMFNYTHPGGGQNGHTFMRAWYKNNHWIFDTEK